MTEEKKRKSPAKVCLACGADALAAAVTLTRLVPLAARGGSVKVGGVKITQIDVRDAFIKTPRGEDRRIRGPIYCTECGAEHHMVVPSDTILRLGPLTDAYGTGTTDEGDE